jgi:hypothetical protein
MEVFLSVLLIPAIIGLSLIFERTLIPGCVINHSINLLHVLWLSPVDSRYVKLRIRGDSSFVSPTHLMLTNTCMRVALLNERFASFRPPAVCVL